MQNEKLKVLEAEELIYIFTDNRTALLCSSSIMHHDIFTLPSITDVELLTEAISDRLIDKRHFVGAILSPTISEAATNARNATRERDNRDEERDARRIFRTPCIHVLHFPGPATP